MKEKAPIKEGLKLNDYSFKYQKKEYHFVIQEPTFEQLAAALTETTKKGKTDVLAGGKTVWELCCVKYDDEIDKNAKLLISICAFLFDEYVMTLDLEINKN